MPAILDLLGYATDIERLRELLRRGENPNATDEWGRTALHYAAQKFESNLPAEEELLLVVRELIDSGANVNLQDGFDYTPLHLATICRNYEIVSMLLQANADVNKTSMVKYTALHYIIIKNTGFSAMAASRIPDYGIEIKIFKLLLSRNPNVDAQNCTGETPLMLAVEENKLEMVEELLKKNADVNLKNLLFDETAIYNALRDWRLNVNILLTFMRHGCLLNEHKIFYCQLLQHIQPPPPVENVKYVLKLLMLDGGDLGGDQIQHLKNLYTSGNGEFMRFVYVCRSENRKMRIDILAPNYSVYDIASRGAFSTAEVNANNPIPHEISDSMIDKLLKRHYPVYCDIIVWGLGSPCMNEKFVEICFSKKLFNGLFNPDILKTISFYLPHLDILNFIYAVSTA